MTLATTVATSVTTAAVAAGGNSLSPPYGCAVAVAVAVAVDDPDSSSRAGKRHQGDKSAEKLHAG